MSHAEGAALSARIESLAVPPGQLAVWALGQAGFALKGGDTIAYIDPYLSDSITAGGGPERRIPIPIDPTTITHADVVFATHAHSDHVDVATLVPLLAASPRAVLVTSVEGAEQATKAGIAADRIVTPSLGVEATVGGLRYRAIPAAHYGFEVDAEGRSRFQGFLLSCNGVTLYHAGDTILIPELLAALDGVAIDLALLPFNGRDFFREERSIVGNLLPSETVALAQRLQARVMIGMHNDLFSGNRVNPALLWDELERQAPTQRAHLLQPGELYLYAG